MREQAQHAAKLLQQRSHCRRSSPIQFRRDFEQHGNRLRRAEILVHCGAERSGARLAPIELLIRRRFDTVEKRARLSRYGCDCYAFALLAAGHIDLVIEAGLKPYDVGGLIPLIEQAGGIMTNWDGGPAEMGGEVIAAGDPALHAQVLELLNS